MRCIRGRATIVSLATVAERIEARTENRIVGSETYVRMYFREVIDVRKTSN